MKANAPRSWLTLPKREQKAIEEYVKEVAGKEMARESRVLLEMYLKISCILQHDVFGKGEKSLTMYLGNHRTFFRSFKKLQTQAEQMEYINERISKIFKNGFPQEFVDGLLDDNVTVVEGQEV
jgi:hypothetical protein